MNNTFILEDSHLGLNCKIYERAKVKNCNLSNNVVIGEDSFVTNSCLGDYVQINRRNQIDDIVIGNRSFTGANTILRHAEIGKYTSISWNVSLGGGGRHHYDYLSSHPFAQLSKFGIVDNNEEITFPKTLFGNDVWIGMDTTIIAGVNIGDGAVIGAGSVVTKDVPPFSIAYGSPARVQKMRFDNKTIETLLEICWWNWPDEIIKKNIDLFSRPLQEPDVDRLSIISNNIKIG